tara:strand:- start:247 stop:1251 length:1005 start_codon:yes stop_codon:yes gene_type:complete
MVPMMHIAIDAEGGDFAPGNIVKGALSAACQLKCGLTFVGNRRKIENQISQQNIPQAVDVQFVDAGEVIEMSEDPVAAFRSKSRSSVKQSVELVASGKADAVFSAGNTGATVLAAHATFGLLPGVHRPALVTVMPSRRGNVVLLDAGANVQCRPQHLLQFAIMGCVYARLLLAVLQPKVGLLSIGQEAIKGNELTRESHSLLRKSTLDFIGNIEAKDLYNGEADVIVCDGFTGNITLKVSEGLVEVLEELLSEELRRTVFTRFNALLLKNSFKRFRRRIDYSEVGGALLLGVNGLCVIGHGSSSVKAVENAVKLAHQFANEKFVDRLGSEIISK